MKVNLKLLVIILSLEILYLSLLFIILLFSFFMYFGSGAGAESQIAITSGKIGNLVLVLPPILFNLYKIKISHSEQKSIVANTYVTATFLYCAFVFFIFKSGFLSS
ncbi:hypothetical protein [Flavobacterium filum]|uniref:hypothetical protein n=1 Tax=Flavobacterium TaxID=237 RepID=UPI00047D1734|nr:hypothetical protein [Flavobacterium filum]